ncbi:hypothetical protein CWO17_21040 [Vibrio sp. 10N.286.45.A3]|uniref:hypothetical protein n=1 Tax=unclassified Vibrio TaxID=2614977 RepID=UPI000D351FCF|nr:MULTISPECIES: hypothetical protein [unclassified Vibrio]PTO98074.1 hypothetical protein CWO17_21040 [Vibrio sp. 10N.286.45.A3]TKE74659.1 hypothetical protein FCV56_23705 [Vibrio sp. F12]TKF01753.1 hypothetical protein FCV61_03790 [Vibrio sp. F12]
MKINVSTSVSFLLLILLGCQEEIGGEVQKVVVKEKVFARELLLSQHEMVSFSEIVKSRPQTANSNEPIEFEVMSGKEFVKLTKDKKIIALQDGEAQLKNKRNGDLYYLKIDSNDLSTNFLNIALIDLYTGLVQTEDVLTAGHRYAIGLSSRFPFKQSDVQLKTRMEKLVQQDTVGNIFLTPTEEDLQDEEEQLLIQIQVNDREYAKYFKIQPKQLSGSKLIADPQKRFLPVGAKVAPLVSYVNADGQVHPVRAELLTYVIEGKPLSLAELHDFLSDPGALGRHEILVKHPNIVEAARINYEMVTLGEFVAMFGVTVNLPPFPEALQAHVDVPYRVLITSNGIDVTSLVELEVSPDGAGRIEDGFLMMSDKTKETSLVSVSINGSKLSSYLPHSPDYYRVKVDKTDLHLNLDVADSLYTKWDRDLPPRVLLNDINVTNRNLNVEFINANGEKVPGSKGKKAWSSCNFSFSDPWAMVLFDDKIYGVPGNQTHESLFTFDCRERDYINPIQAIDFVAISSMGSKEVINRYGVPSLNHFAENNFYSISYDKLGQQPVQVNVSPFLNDLFNHYSKNWVIGPYTVSGSEDLIVDSRGNLTFLGSFQPSPLTLKFQGEEQITYDIEVDYNAIEASDTHIYNQNYHSMTLAKNIELNGQQLSLADIPYLKGSVPITVSAINEEGENTDITSYVRFKADKNTENDAIILSGNRLYMNTQEPAGQYRFDLFDKDYRQALSSVLFNVVDTMKIHAIQGPHLDTSIPVGSIGRLAFKRKDGSDYEIKFNRTTRFLRSYQYLSTMYSNIFSKSGGNILPVDTQIKEINTIGSAYRNGFGISDNLMAELKQPVQYDFEITDPSGNLLFSQSR